MDDNGDLGVWGNVAMWNIELGYLDCFLNFKFKKGLELFYCINIIAKLGCFWIFFFSF